MKILLIPFLVRNKKENKSNHWIYFLYFILLSQKETLRWFRIDTKLILPIVILSVPIKIRFGDLSVAARAPMTATDTTIVEVDSFRWIPDHAFFRFPYHSCIGDSDPEGCKRL